MKTSLILSSKLNLLDKRSLYLRINLLLASSPYSDSCSNPSPLLKVEIILGACANTLCSVGVIFAHGKEFKTKSYSFWHTTASSSVSIRLPQLYTLKIAPR